MKKVVLLSASAAASSLLFVYLWPGIFPLSGGHVSAPLVCHDQQKADPTLKTSDNPTLRKLAEYEEVCKGAVVNELMTFAAMPRTIPEAITSANHTAAVLKEFAAHDIKPLVVFEPAITPALRLADIHHGVYDEPLKMFYETLRQQNITDPQMGTWVLFPEANTPIWNTTDPNDFVQNIKKVGTLQKAVFPGSKISLLLNSRTYPNHDAAWEHGSLKSLDSYVVDLPLGLVDRLGYQGFPSISEADAAHPYRLTKAKDFLPANLAQNAAKKIDIKDIWINTGTFSRIYTNDPKKEGHLTASERRDILSDILDQIALLDSASLQVSVNLFAEDKSLMSEHIDWSYWHKNTIGQGDDANVFIWFVSQLRSKGIDLSLYDSL